MLQRVRMVCVVILACASAVASAADPDRRRARSETSPACVSDQTAASRFEQLNANGLADSDEAARVSADDLRSSHCASAVVRAAALERSARQHAARREIAAAATAASEALALLRATSRDALALARMRATLGQIRTLQDRHAEATALHAAAWHVLALLPANAFAIRVQVQRSQALGQADRLDEAFATLASARTMAEACATTPAALQAELGIAQANLERMRGDTAAALATIEDADRILDRSPAPPPALRVRALLTHAQILRASGDVDGAERFYRAGIELDSARPSEGGANLAALHNGLGLCLNFKESFADAALELEQALTLASGLYGERSALVGKISINLANSERYLGHIGRAVELYERSVRNSSALSAKDVGLAENNLATVYLWQGRYAEAEVLQRRYLRRLADTDELQRRGTLGGLAVSLLAQGRNREAFGLAVDAEHIRQRALRRASKDLGERHAVAASDSGGGLDIVVALAARGGERVRVATAWTLAMQSNGIITASRLRQLAAARAAAEPRLASQWQRWQQGNETLVAARRLAAEHPDVGHADTLRVAEAAFDRAERALLAQLGKLPLPDEPAVTLSGMVAQLPPDAVLIRYGEFDSVDPQQFERPSVSIPARMFAFMVSGKSAPRLYDLGDRDEIKALAQRWYRAASSAAAPSGELLAAGNALRSRIWDPLTPAMGGRAAFVIGSESLARVNPAALPTPDGGYLTDNGLRVQLLDHESELMPIPSRPAGRLVAIGMPDNGIGQAGADPTLPCGVRAPSRLVHAGEEIDAVVALWQQGRGEDPLQRLVGAQATEAATRRLIEGAEIVHFATHGVALGTACASQPASDLRGVVTVDDVEERAERAQPSAALLLAGLRGAGGDAANDGLLSGEEVAALDLSATRWAVLSACETALGENVVGEGVFGLRRGFRLAGAHTVIMSLWKVDDAATSRWMRSLYRARLVGHATTLDAVADATRETLAERRAAGLSTSPYYWAAFVASGDWR